VRVRATILSNVVRVPDVSAGATAAEGIARACGMAELGMLDTDNSLQFEKSFNQLQARLVPHATQSSRLLQAACTLPTVGIRHSRVHGCAADSVFCLPLKR
jgi:uncharacterized membrane protein YgdD (TMEM256/DUF423 family)